MPLSKQIGVLKWRHVISLFLSQSLALQQRLQELQKINTWIIIAMCTTPQTQKTTSGFDQAKYALFNGMRWLSVDNHVSCLKPGIKENHKKGAIICTTGIKKK